MKTPGPTCTSMGPKAALPTKCCNGMRRARCATRSRYLPGKSAAASVKRNCVRETPSRWAASSSAST
ncbi:Uncharacterised protein [Mycobacteroides abscessus subsp. abscessus]|nr:Uncharacterised protein [Mycobacteroides abscessus subsp. abscessus]SKU01772.1 Uncharacterised protein [Mycobacteroides abscessus subsp. abscessus]